MTTKEKIAVMQAYLDGKKIQLAIKNKEDWEDYDTGEPVWDWTCFDYRIKPEEEKPKRMTHRQLAEWCSMGKGLVKYSIARTVRHYYWFYEYERDKEIPDNIVIMPKGTNDWIEPTVEIYERDCKGNDE